MNITKNDKMITQPEELEIELFNHQKSIIRGMIKRENNGHILISSNDRIMNLKFNLIGNNILCTDNSTYKINSNFGILNSRTGSGKTLIVIGLILLQQCPPIYEHITYGSNYINISDMTKYHNVKTNLIILNPKLINYWLTFMKYAPILDYYICQNDKQLVELNISNIKNYNIIFVSSKKYNLFTNKFINICWSRIIIDDADTVILDKNINVTFNTNFIWLLSCNLNIVINNKSLSVLTNNLNEIILKNLTLTCDDDYIDESMTIPKIKCNMIKCYEPIDFSSFGSLLPIIKLVKDNNITELVKTLNCNANTSENIYNKIEINIKKKTKSDERLLSLKQKIIEIDKENCPICLERLNNPILIECCHNIFCIECILQNMTYYNYNCPFCKQLIETKDINLITSKIENNIKTDSDKLSMLLNIIGDGQYVIYVHNHQLCDYIYMNLMMYCVTVKQFAGNKVKNIINDFDNGKTKILLLNSKNYGNGYYLENVLNLIIYQRCGEDIENMIIGRMNRYGRKDPLNIYYLINNNEEIPNNITYPFESVIHE